MPASVSVCVFVMCAWSMGGQKLRSCQLLCLLRVSLVFLVWAVRNNGISLLTIKTAIKERLCLIGRQHGQDTLSGWRHAQCLKGLVFVGRTVCSLFSLDNVCDRCVGACSASLVGAIVRESARVCMRPPRHPQAIAPVGVAARVLARPVRHHGRLQLRDRRSGTAELLYRRCWSF